MYWYSYKGLDISSLLAACAKYNSEDSYTLTDFHYFTKAAYLPFLASSYMYAHIK